MTKRRSAVALAAVMLAFQLIFCLFPTINECNKKGTKVYDSYSTVEMLQNYTDTINEINNWDDPSDDSLSIKNNCEMILVFTYIIILTGVASLICGIMFCESHPKPCAIFLIGSALMALLPIILQFSLEGIYRTQDIERVVSFSFLGWLQLLLDLPVFFTLLYSHDDEEERTNQPPVRETTVAPTVTTPVVPTENGPVFCQHCGNKVIAGASFCAVCGKEVPKINK